MKSDTRIVTKAGRGLWRKILVGIVGLALVLGLVFAIVLVSLARGVQAPNWVKNQVQTLLNESLPNANVSITEMSLVLAKGSLRPKLTVSDIQILDSSGRLQMVLPAIETQVSRQEIIRGRIRPVSIILKNAVVKLNRSVDGKIDVLFGTEDASVAERELSSVDILTAIENVFAQPALSRLEKIESHGTQIILYDAVTKRDWTFTDGRVVIANQDEVISGTIAFKIQKTSTEDGEAILSWRQPLSGEQAQFTAKFSDIAPSDIARQIAIPDWLSEITTPLSGSITVKLEPESRLGDISGVLEIGAGQILSDKGNVPLTMRHAKLYFKYDSDRAKVVFDDIAVETDALQLKAQGQVLVSDDIFTKDGSVVSQLRFSKAVISPARIFASPVEIDAGTLDMRVQFSPLRVDIGQLVLEKDDSKIVVRGSAVSDNGAWTTSLDARLNSISTDNILSLWPVSYKDKTRDWFAKNIHSGVVSNVEAALRALPGEKPTINVGFDLSDMTVRYMKLLPVVHDGQGYGVLTHKDLLIAVDQGIVSVPGGGDINVAGTSLFIPEIRMKNAPAEISLATKSSLRAAMGLLDMPPFSFMSKGGVDLDLAQGRATSDGIIKLPLAKKVTFDQVEFSIDGHLTDVQSTKLIKDKKVFAETLKLRADNHAVTISGAAVLGETPVRGRWTQTLGPKGKGQSRLDGTIELSQRFLDEFAIALPKGSVTGAGTANITIILAKDTPPDFHLVSDLNRLKLELGAVGWSKPANVTGSLEVRGQMTSPMSIRLLRLKTKGLDLSGKVALNPDGSLKVAEFESVKLDGWLDAEIAIRPKGKNSLQIDVVNGRADFRKSKFAKAKPSSQENSVRIKLRKLILSSGISLTDFAGDISAGQGISGSFSAKVNGGARIVGTLAPINSGVGVRFTSDDAGAVMRSAGVFDSAIGGRMDMVLLPTDNRGQYDGTFHITKTRVRNASALAEILAAVSVIGLIEQLGTEGIAFNTVDASFRLTPKTAILYESSAIGASMGITMDGLYDFGSAQMDMNGVITPIYALNGMLEQTGIFGNIFGKKKGEGLFSFNYNLKGNVDAPKVTVNPLSILTPGFFRDIFKAPAPKPKP